MTDTNQTQAPAPALGGNTRANFVTLDEFVEAVGIDKPRILRQIGDGKIPGCARIGTLYLIPRKFMEIEELVKLFPIVKGASRKGRGRKAKAVDTTVPTSTNGANPMPASFGQAQPVAAPIPAAPTNLPPLNF